MKGSLADRLRKIYQKPREARMDRTAPSPAPPAFEYKASADGRQYFVMLPKRST